MPAGQSDPTLAERKNTLYAAAVERQGGQAVLLDASASADERTAAFDAMDALLLSGGADISPEHYGRGVAGARATEPERDALELEAWNAATGRNVPILGICRGFQAINAFSGGTCSRTSRGTPAARGGTADRRRRTRSASHPARASHGSSSRPTSAAASSR